MKTKKVPFYVNNNGDGMQKKILDWPTRVFLVVCVAYIIAWGIEGCS